MIFLRSALNLPHRPTLSRATALPVLAAMVWLSLALGGCGGPRSKIPNWENMPIKGQQTSVAQVGEAIKYACERRGWKIESNGKDPTSAIATYTKGRLMAAVNLNWTRDSYSMTYRDNRGFGYQPERNAIHPRFVNWMRGLRRTINAELKAAANL